jgi:hypothetical protein
VPRHSHQFFQFLSLVFNGLTCFQVFPIFPVLWSPTASSTWSKPCRKCNQI